MGKGSAVIVQLFAVCLVLICASAAETNYAFFARVGLGFASFTYPNATIRFNDVLTNTGNAYTGSTGVYTCPVSGLYQFMVTIMSSGTGMEAHLIAKGLIEIYINAVGSTSGSNNILLYLNAGDQVYVRVHHGTYVDRFRSTFSGLLIQGI